MGAAETLGGAVEHELGGANRIGKDVRIPETHDAPADAFEIFGARCVVVLPIEMLAPVEFDSEFCLAAGKVDNAISHYQLPRESWPVAR